MAFPVKTLINKSFWNPMVKPNTMKRQQDGWSGDVFTKKITTCGTSEASEKSRREVWRASAAHEVAR